MSIDLSLNSLKNEKIRSDTALEVNESTQDNYRSDLIYLFFKLLMFVILGVVFYFLFKNQNAGEMLEQAKESVTTFKETAKIATEKVKVVADTIKSASKRGTNTNLKN